MPHSHERPAGMDDETYKKTEKLAQMMSSATTKITKQADNLILADHDRIHHLTDILGGEGFDPYAMAWATSLLFNLLDALGFPPEQAHDILADPEQEFRSEHANHIVIAYAEIWHNRQGEE